MRVRTLVFVSVVAVAALLFLPAPAMAEVSAMGLQKWYPGSVGPFPRTAWRGAPGGTSQTDPINDGVSRQWVSDEAAAADANMAGNWQWSLSMQQSGDCGTIELSVGVWDPVAETFTAAGTKSIALDGSLLYTSADLGPILAPGPFVIEAGQFLGIRINNVEDGCRGNDGNVHLDADDLDTWVESPATAPDFPVPELSTLLLAGAGLGAVGLVVARRKP